ncbi:hypothetical protein CYY_000507 [Polysphondylium violaceum]|uniref:PLAC8 family protein n=1 Tax=Polysphondylium violaceum TaxID=133409 RepID=A0A8J4Q3R2_9MYCE|nr:hypothetical protein CYY_000507 [Polysphondylium violaceum]
MNSNWSSSLFDCCSVPFISFITCLFCPCQVARQRATIVNDCGCGLLTFTCCCLPLVACLNRFEIREKYKIRGNAISDCVCCCLCGCCATVQQARELELRGDKPGSLCMEGPSSFDQEKSNDHNAPNLNFYQTPPLSSSPHKALLRAENINRNSNQDDDDDYGESRV